MAIGSRGAECRGYGGAADPALQYVLCRRRLVDHPRRGSEAALANPPLSYHPAMHVALMTCSDWLDEELASFLHLCVGLFDEQVRITQVMPDDLPVDDAAPFGQRLSWRESGWRFLRRRRLAQLAPHLAGKEITVVHAVSSDLWRGALDLGEKIEAAVVLTVGCQEDLDLAEDLRKPIEEARAGLAATTQPLADALKQRLGAAALIRLTPPGVHAAETVAPARSEGTPFCAAISGGGQFDADYEALFAALRRIVDDHPEAQFFVDVQSADGHSLYRRARQLKLLANLSMVPHRLGHRDDLLGAGVLIHPQPLGQSRSITLAAMARGVPVLARRDNWLDYLIDDQTAWLVDKPDARRWEELLRLLILAPEDGAALGQRARQWVQTHRSPSQHVAATIDLYRQTTGEAIRFPA